MKIRIALIALSLLSAGFARAEYPVRTIKIIVGISAGAAADTVMRMLAEKMSIPLGVPLLVENRSGAEGRVAAEALISAKPDGYTLLAMQNGMLPFAESFTLIGDVGIHSRPLIVVSSTLELGGMRITTLKQLADFARANPGVVTYATGGATLNILCAEKFFGLIGTKGVQVAYRSGAQAVVDVAEARVHMFCGLHYGNAHSLIKDGRLLPLAFVDEQSPKEYPNVPPIARAGVPELSEFPAIRSMIALVGPLGMSEPIVARLVEALQEAMRDPDILRRFEQQEFEANRNCLSDCLKKVIENQNAILR